MGEQVQDLFKSGWQFESAAVTVCICLLYCYAVWQRDKDEKKDQEIRELQVKLERLEADREMRGIEVKLELLEKDREIRELQEELERSKVDDE